ncbi:MAG: hypothetical protein JRF52_00595 [Deltaproteobacteria bacterium]|nr:hypothetical protein [Deltaproteobacteria bacterium]
MKKRLFLLLPLLLLFLSLQTQLWAAYPEIDYKASVSNLESLLQSINNLSRMISATQEVLHSAKGAGREQELRLQINELTRKLRQAEANFDRLSANADLSTFQEKEKREVDWNQELTELIGPLIAAMKRVTSRPRKIEELRSNIEQYELQQQTVKKANANLLALMSYISNPKLMEKLNAVIRIWQKRGDEIDTQMAIAVQQLEKALGEKKSLSQSFQELFEIFFKSSGKNLLLAFLAFAFVWVALHYLHKLIQRLSPFHKKDRTFVVRVFDLLYVIFTVVLSFLILLGVLYSLGDWVLLSIAIIFVLGIGWASKQALPRFWTQATLMLNFGAVREGEVVIYKGIPYEVISVNIYSQLENKDLEDGFIRLHINDLVDLRSRPMFENEPWFPSRRGDWVKLNDGTYGKVVAQTPDMVKLRMHGGAHKFYKTSDYLSQSPANLSSGFRVPVTFGLDYQHQAVITKEVPGIIEKAIIEGLTEEGYEDSIERINVEFKEAGPSSLDIIALAEFNANAGPKYWALERAIQRICVDTCNLHGWIIPFQQVTVHMAEPEDRT